jgi:hypothetical protein
LTEKFDGGNLPVSLADPGSIAQVEGLKSLMVNSNKLPVYAQLILLPTLPSGKIQSQQNFDRQQ